MSIRSTFNNLPIAKKLALILAVSCLGLLTLIALNLIDYCDTLVSEKKNELKSLVDTARSSVEMNAQLWKEGKLSEADAKAEAMKNLSGLRYGSDGHF